MTKAGFKLPKTFLFCPLNDILKEKPLGIYVAEENAVCINADYPEFTDLRAQNKLEESQGSYHPTTKHFLETYLHEFSHAAHFNNLKDKYGENKALEIFNGILNDTIPDEALAGMMNSAVKNMLSGFGSKIIDSLVPPTNGLYSLTNLKEYFAEKNSTNLAQQLGNNFNTSNIKNNFATSYIPHPADWNIIEQFRKVYMKNVSKIFDLTGYRTGSLTELVSDFGELLYQDILYTDGDIYHGVIDNLKKNRSFKKKDH